MEILLANSSSSLFYFLQLEIKNHMFFAPINWDDLYNKKITPPFDPNVVSGLLCCRQSLWNCEEISLEKANHSGCFSGIMDLHFIICYGFSWHVKYWANSHDLHFVLWYCSLPLKKNWKLLLGKGWLGEITVYSVCLLELIKNLITHSAKCMFQKKMYLIVEKKHIVIF